MTSTTRPRLTLPPVPINTRVYLGLGSNADRQANLTFAVRELSEQLSDLRCSPVYANADAAYGGAEYLNLVVTGTTTLEPAMLLGWLKRLETRTGRDRVLVSRVSLDIDLLLYGELVGKHGGATLPHPSILVHAHVLKPLADLAPRLLHPTRGEAMLPLWHGLERKAPLIRIDSSSLVSSGVRQPLSHSPVRVPGVSPQPASGPPAVAGR